MYHHDVEDEPEYVYDSFNNRLMYFETFDTSGAEAELVSTTYYFYNGLRERHAEGDGVGGPRAGREEVSFDVSQVRDERARGDVSGGRGVDLSGVGLCGDVRPGVSGMMGARQRFLNRELDPVALTDGIVDVESETWSDYVGDSIYADFTFDGSTVTVPRIYEPGMGKVDGLSVGGAAYYHADHIGTTRLLSGYNGSADDESVYSAFGGLVSGTNHRYGYAGKTRLPVPRRHPPSSTSEPATTTRRRDGSCRGIRLGLMGG